MDGFGDAGNVILIEQPVLTQKACRDLRTDGPVLPRSSTCARPMSCKSAAASTRSRSAKPSACAMVSALRRTRSTCLKSWPIRRSGLTTSAIVCRDVGFDVLDFLVHESGLSLCGVNVACVFMLTPIAGYRKLAGRESRGSVERLDAPGRVQCV